MQNNIYVSKLANIKEYDSNTHTLTIDNKKDEVYHIIFDDSLLSNFSITLINSNVSIIEIYKKYASNLEFVIDIDADSSLKRFSILVDNDSNQKVSRIVNNNGIYHSMQLDLNDYDIDSIENINLLSSEAIANVIDGIYAAKKANKKYQTNLNHYVRDTKSTAQIFAINDDNAHVSIYTDAYIKNKATGTKTNQEGRIINLSDTCSGIVLPNLHIDENDVEASHSCSVGSVNQEHLYYLQTRGLDEKQARNILIKGYFNPIIGNIDDDSIKDEINAVLDKRIG